MRSSKSAVLARDEREAAGVFDAHGAPSAHLAEKGRRPGNRREILKHVGRALLVRQRVSGRVAVEEKPDVLWDRPDLERLYARLEDEYELRERATALRRKLEVIGDTAQALTDLIDTERGLRLELIIVLLILFEIAITFVQMYLGRAGALTGGQAPCLRRQCSLPSFDRLVLGFVARDVVADPDGHFFPHLKTVQRREDFEIAAADLVG